MVLILNFRSSPTGVTARNQATSVIVSDIRRVQSMALSGGRYQGNVVCGYGIHYVGTTSYNIYAKAVPVSGPCSSVATRNYQLGDLAVETKVLINTNLEFRTSFYDIFFEPPDPKTYINDRSSLNTPPATITIQLKNQQNCAQGKCTDIRVYTSGQIDLTQ